MTIPELPEPDGTAEVVVGSERVGGMIADVVEYREAWSEANVRRYGDECYRAGIERYESVLRAERDHARAQYERATEILNGIWSLLSPDLVESGGKTYRFVNPHANETLDELSRRIKAIPDKLAAIRAEAAKNEPTRQE